MAEENGKNGKPAERREEREASDGLENCLKTGSPRRLKSRRGLKYSKKLCSLFCRNKPKRKPYRRLLQSYPMAHRGNCLVLLYPYPDTVRSPRLHKTLVSTLLIRRSLPFIPPRKTIGPAVADCRFRAPQTPRPAQYRHFNRKNFIWQVKWIIA